MSDGRHWYQIRKSTLESMFTIRRDKLSRMLALPFQKVVRWCLYTGILVCYICSLSPWFTWSISNTYFVIVLPLFLVALALNRKMEHPLLRRTKVHISIAIYIAASFCMSLLGHYSFMGTAAMLLQVPIFYSILRFDREELMRLSDFLCKAMGWMMCISIPFFVYHLAGGSLPHQFAYNEKLQYTFDNFYFFMINDSNERIIPRFHAFFLEPGHVGTACTFLLLTQIGRWKRWYNIVLAFTSIITLSLAAYVLMVMAFFLSAWIRKRAVVGKVLITATFVGAFFIFAMNYNRGVNVVNMLIVERLSIGDDGKMEGDNRVNNEFKKEFDRYIESGEILTGGPKSMDKFEWGNAGYRVFIYSYGIITTLLVILFAFSITKGAHMRPKWGMLIIAAATFWARANPFHYFFFVPLFMMAQIGWRDDPDYHISTSGNDINETTSNTPCQK